jgi:hypothetical protein
MPRTDLDDWDNDREGLRSKVFAGVGAGQVMSSSAWEPKLGDTARRRRLIASREPNLDWEPEEDRLLQEPFADS